MIKPLLKIISFGIAFRFHKSLKSLNRGGRSHRRFRFLLFRKPIIRIPFLIAYLGYDTCRSGFNFLGIYLNGLFILELAPIGLRINQFLIHGDKKNLLIATRHRILDIPVGSIIYNIELRPGFGGKLVRAAGTFALLLAKDLDYNFCILRFNSGIKYKLSLDCSATIGRVSNLEHKNKFRFLAGYSRRMGRRPKVRGVAKNPVDHPNGGRTCGGKLFRNVTGRIIKNKKTTKYLKKQVNKYIYSIYN